MDDYQKIPAAEVFFLADSHFRDARQPGETERRRRFIGFMSTIPSGAALFLLGDIFDFYFEYASVVPKRYFDILRSLSDCVGRGVEVHFLAGNHDYWFDSFLRDDVGVIPHGDDVLFECQQRRIWCTHGDLLPPGNKSYRTIRSIIRNRFSVAAAKVLHPDLLDAIASRISQGSKNRNRRSVKDMAYQLAGLPAKELFSNGNDILVVGHIHYPLHEIKEGKDLVIVGDWITQFTFARLSGGRISLETFTPGERD